MPLEIAQGRAGLALLPLTADMGAEVCGVDLAQPLTGPVAEVLHDALIEHGVLLVRDQQAGAADLARLADQLATIEEQTLHLARHQAMPGARVVAAPLAASATGWRTIGSAEATPATLVLAGGGNGRIAFADQREAARRLPRALRARIETLRALHRDPATSHAAEHPLLRRHPITGEAALYVNAARTRRVLNQTAAESTALLDRLLAAATEEAVTWRHLWAPGDVLLWDNRRVLHDGSAATRFVLGGDQPAGLAALEMPWVSAG